MEIVVAIALVVTLAVIAFAKGANDGPGNPITLSGPTDGKSPDSCQEASAKWDAARQMQCNARAAEAAARNRADGIRAQMLAFTASAVSLGIAGGATLAAAGTATATVFGIPLAIILYGIAIGLFILAAAAQTSAAYFAGQLVTAEADANAKSAARAAWDAEVAKARSEVNAKCSLADATATLSRTAPC